jgi:hypothetical protein
VIHPAVGREIQILIMLVWLDKRNQEEEEKKNDEEQISFIPSLTHSPYTHQ